MTKCVAVLLGTVQFRLKVKVVVPENATLKDAEKALGRTIDFCVPKNAAMQMAAEMGQPLNEVSGGKSLEAKLAAMMAEIFERIQAISQAEAIRT